MINAAVVDLAGRGLGSVASMGRVPPIIEATNNLASTEIYLEAILAFLKGDFEKGTELYERAFARDRNNTPEPRLVARNKKRIREAAEGGQTQPKHVQRQSSQRRTPSSRPPRGSGQSRGSGKSRPAQTSGPTGTGPTNARTTTGRKASGKSRSAQTSGPTGTGHAAATTTSQSPRSPGLLGMLNVPLTANQLMRNHMRQPVQVTSSGMPVNPLAREYGSAHIDVPTWRARAVARVRGD